MPVSMYGVGPHGFDWAVGTWACTSTSHVSSATLRVTRTGGGQLLYRSSGKSFDNAWYAVYMPKTKTWVAPFIVDDGSYGTESTNQSGKKIVWTGTAYFADSGKTLPVRDTNVNGPNTYSDVGEVQSNGAWKTEYSVNCTKT